MNKQRERLEQLLQEARTEEKRLALFGDIDTQIDMPKGDEFTAAYLLANGVLCPPFKVGDTVWAIIRDTVRECQIHHYKIFSETQVICFEEKAYRGRHYEWSAGYVGVTLFKTKEEAEEALGGMQG